jgi:hypothetical protein|tara:strand:+ start:640 stop:819 length:180 start_codon:yes stop_codon:yes gene_type:complete
MAKTGRIAGKAAIVTGAASGIGQVTAQALPGAILTPLWDDLKVPQKERRRYAKMVPANR